MSNNNNDNQTMETPPASPPPPTTTTTTQKMETSSPPTSPTKQQQHSTSPHLAPSTPTIDESNNSTTNYYLPSTPNDNNDGLVGLNIAGGGSIINNDLTPIMRNVSYIDGGAVAGAGGAVGGISGVGGIGGGVGNIGGGMNRGVLQQRRPLPPRRSSSSNTTNTTTSSKGGRSLRSSSTGFFPATSPPRSSNTTPPTATSILSGGGGLLDGGVSAGTIPPPSQETEGGVLNFSPTPLEMSIQDSSLPGIYSNTEDDDDDDDSTFMEDESSNRSSTNNKRGGVVVLPTSASERHVKKKTKEGGNNGLFLAPIELKPERKFFSFQGSLQYKSQVATVQRGELGGGGGGEEVVEEEGRPTPSSSLLGDVMIHSSPSSRRPLMSSETRVENTNHHHQPKAASFIIGSPKPYEPSGRSQHGVTEMADTKELDAIFKSPRNTVTTTTTTRTPSQSPLRSCAEGGGGAAAATTTTTTSSSLLLHPTVVTPAKAEEEEEEPSTTTTMITNLPPNQDPEEFLHPFPLDDRDYSIPSIRLANAVHRSDSLASYEMYSRTFSYDEDESTWEGSFYLDEEDDLDTEASWSTNGGGSIGSLRRRQYLRHLSSGRISEGGQQLQQEERMLSGSLHGLRHLNSSSEGQTSSSSNIPAIAPSNSFMERMQGITINPRSNTFDSSSDVESYQGGGGVGGPPVVLNVVESSSNNPALMIDATQSMDDAEYETRQDRRVRRSNHHNHRSARRSRRSSHGRTSSAVEWIQGLQNPSNGGGVQIVEAASSKFLTGGADGVGAEKAAAASEDVSKALGMPHPLCRSSTIEAGPFVNRAVAATAHDMD